MSTRLFNLNRELRTKVLKNLSNYGYMKKIIYEITQFHACTKARTAKTSTLHACQVPDQQLLAKFGQLNSTILITCAPAIICKIKSCVVKGVWQVINMTNELLRQLRLHKLLKHNAAVPLLTNYNIESTHISSLFSELFTTTTAFMHEMDK